MTDARHDAAADPDDIALVIASLEAAAEAGDLTEAFFAAYEARCGDSASVMAHMDATMRGRMLAGVLDLMLIPTAAEQARYMDFEVGNHVAYGARPHMYPPLFDALRTVVREACGAHWDDATAAAWSRRSDALLAEIDARDPAAPGRGPDAAPVTASREIR